MGERIGRGEPDEAGRAIGGGICLFAVFGVLLMVVLLAGAETLARLLHAPEEAFAETVKYIRICGGGSLFIVAYNVLGAVFRGIGDARTPLFTVMLACVINIGGDLLLVEGFHLGAAGAALATVAAQAVSVVVSLSLIHIYTVTEELAEEYGCPRGVAVQSVREGSDAQRQGVLPNDVIVAVNGETITDMDQLQAIKEGLAVGDVLTFRLWRGGHYLERDVALVDQYTLEE